MAINDDILENYIEKVLSVKNRQEVTAEELKKISLELGLSESDLNDIAKTVQEHRLRAKNYLEHSCWDDAVAELEKSLALSPMDPGIYYELAHSYYKRGVENKSKRDLKKAEELAKECIRYSPDYKKAYDLLQFIHQSPPGKSGQGNKKALVNGVVFAGIIVAVFFIIFVFPFKTGEKQNSRDFGETEIPGDQEINIIPGQDDEQEMPLGKRSLPVRVIDDPQLASLTINTRESVLSPLLDSFSYELKVDITVENIVLRELTFRVALVDDSGVTYVDTMYALRDYRPGILPGNTLPANVLMYYEEEMPDVIRAEVSVAFIKQEPYTRGAMDYPVKEMTWIVPQPAGVSLGLVERENSLSGGFNSTYHRLVFEVTNNGTRSLEVLKLAVNWFDENGNIFAKDETYVASSQDPTFLPGQTRIGFIFKNFKETQPDPGKYRVSIIEIR